MTSESKPLDGRRIRVVAPARWITHEVADAFGARAKGWGAEVELDPQCFAQDGQLAGSDEAREAILSAALGDRELVVWAARGGYGALRLLKRLAERNHPPEAPVFAGYSDITAIHQHLLGSKVTAVHAAMPFDLHKPEKAANLDAAAALIGALVGERRPPARRFDLGSVRAGEARAPLIPANLSVLVSLIGTPYEPKWESAILCLEDVDEYLYALDRMFWRLAQSRLAPRIKGLVLGDFAGTLDNEVPWGRSIEGVAAAHFPDTPIASGLPFGHGPINAPLVVGEPARLVALDTLACLTLGPDVA
jgi:muramoyltetrapeptide carboxypeptidase